MIVCMYILYLPYYIVLYITERNSLRIASRLYFVEVMNTFVIVYEHINTYIDDVDVDDDLYTISGMWRLISTVIDDDEDEYHYLIIFFRIILSSSCCQISPFTFIMVFIIVFIIVITLFIIMVIIIFHTIQ